MLILFLDSYFRYNQIVGDLKNGDKTIFIGEYHIDFVNYLLPFRDACQPFYDLVGKYKFFHE